MGSIDSFLGSSLSSLQNLNKKLTGGDDKEKNDENMKKIVEYLYTLTEQLRYMFNNIDEENLTDKAMVRVIEDATEGKFTEVQQTSDAITAIIAGLNEAQKAVRVVFDSDGLTIKNGGFKIVNSNDDTTMSVSNTGNVAIVGSYETETWRSDPSLGVPTRYWSSWDGTRLLFHEFPDGADSMIRGFFGIHSYNKDCQVVVPKIMVQNEYVESIADDFPNVRGGIKMHVDSSNRADFRIVGDWLGETILRMYEEPQYYGCMVEVNSVTGNTYIKINGSTGYITCTGVTQTSSKRYKEDIKPMQLDRAKYLYDMKFSSFRYKNDEELNRGICYGLIAEDVAKLGLNDIVIYDEESRPDAIDYTKLIPYMGKLIQNINTRLERLEKAS